MAKKDVHAMVAGMGLAAGFIEALVTKARARGVSDEAIRSLGTPEGEPLIDQWVEEMARRFRPTVTGPYLTLVSYHVSVEELIEGGGYVVRSRLRLLGADDGPSSTIHIAPRDLYLVCFEEKIPDVSVRAGIDAVGFRPADQREILSFGRQYRGEQLKFDIVGIGTTDRDGYCFALSRTGDGGRALVVHKQVFDWREDVRFLVVRKDS